ncbi:MAG: hypothetical protein E4H28_01430 [Gemmatimonadales bacterium]|nr:MAG: hypothetical protein E4H28_01430 [Gemmatimonadales bacterium]
MKFTPFLMLCALACAKQELPPGTLPDRLPPQVVETHPSYAETVPGFDGDAWIRFDEPLMDPRSIERSLLSSPAGSYQVIPGRTRIRIHAKGGWQDGIVYYFALPSGIADLLRNRTVAPVELLFSTGADVSPTLVHGRVYDRVTSRGNRGARLLFLSPDSVPYTAVSDTGGVFRLPGLPYGDYRAIGFLDQNRDFKYDEKFEPGDVVPFRLTDELTTASVDLWMIPADSTPPVLGSAEVLDSLTVRLTFDDPLDPEAAATDVVVSIRNEPGDRSWTVVDVVVGRPPEMPVVKPDSVMVAPTKQPSGPLRPPAPDFATVTVAEPLIEGTYRVNVSGMQNLRGLSGGGETTVVYAPSPGLNEQELDDAAGPDGPEDAP